MHWIQHILMKIHHGYFMAAGLGIFLTGFLFQLFQNPEVLAIHNVQILTVLGALLLGYGTGRCDQKCTLEKQQDQN